MNIWTENIRLDIGVASVGVGILDKGTGEISHASSRIFPMAADSVEREFRQGRRLDAERSIEKRSSRFI